MVIIMQEAFQIQAEVHRAHEAGEGACNYVNSKIQISGETTKRLLKLVTSIYAW